MAVGGALEAVTGLGVAIQKVHVRKPFQVGAIVGELVGYIDPPEAPRAGEKTFSPESFPGVHRVGGFLVAELHRVLEHLDETRGGVFLADGPNVNDERIAGDLVPFTRKLLSVGLNLCQSDHVQVRMPDARAGAPLDLIRPDRALNAIEHRSTTTLFAFP